MENHNEIPVESPAPQEEKTECPMTVEERIAALSRQITEQMERSAQAEKARREALNEREEALTRREMLSCAREEMEKRGLPVMLAECMAFSDTENMEKGIAILEESFRAAVQAAVEARLLDNAPKVTAMRPLNELPDDEYYAAICRTN